MDRINVTAPSAAYEVLVGKDLLARTAELAEGLFGRTVSIVSDRTVHALHGAKLEDALRSGGHDVRWHIVEPGESAKSWSGLEALSEWLLEGGVSRSDNIIAFGGGVVGDLAGFAASIHKRGCGFVQIPTTLLAQVDSSVGGKTAINSAVGKNMVGAFHQPSLVIADVALLDTLPGRELRAGYAEVLKYGVLGDAPFFEWCEKHVTALMEGDSENRISAVGHCVRAKAAIVAADETEQTGTRALLNLGHTFGHALEAATGFSDRMLHGEAVALGMVLAAKYSSRHGLLGENAAQQIGAAVAVAGLPSALSELGLQTNGTDLADLMRQDKKASSGKVPLILLHGIGAAFVQHEVDLEDVAAFLDKELQAH